MRTIFKLLWIGIVTVSILEEPSRASWASATTLLVVVLIVAFVDSLLSRSKPQEADANLAATVCISLIPTICWGADWLTTLMVTTMTLVVYFHKEKKMKKLLIALFFLLVVSLDRQKWVHWYAGAIYGGVEFNGPMKPGLVLEKYNSTGPFLMGSIQWKTWKENRFVFHVQLGNGAIVDAGAHKENSSGEIIGFDWYLTRDTNDLQIY